MKKAIKIIVGMVALLAIVSVEANDSTFRVRVVGEKQMKVEASNINGAAMTYILDKKGIVIYQQELIQGDELKLTYDLSELKNGAYEFLIEDEYKVQSIPLTIVNSKLEVNAGDREKFFFPTYIQDGRSLIVKQLASEKSDLYVTIRSNAGVDILNEKLDGQLGLIGKRYQLRPGDYSITLSSNDYVRTEFLTFK